MQTNWPPPNPHSLGIFFSTRCPCCYCCCVPRLFSQALDGSQPPGAGLPGCEAPICCLGSRQLKETSHSPILTGPHVTAQGKRKMPAPCLKSIEFQDHESRELNQAQRPAHLHRPPTTTPPRLGGTPPHSCWAQFSHQNVPLLLLP